MPTYPEFWDFYLRAHSKRGTRVLHYVGTLLGLGCLTVAVTCRCWTFIPAAFVVGYGCAWSGHFFIQGNKPATFGHPFWSLYSDFRMLALALSRRLRPHLNRLGI